MRQAVLIAGSLVEQFRATVPRLAEAAANDTSDEAPLLRAELERLYGGIWEQLDAAARLSADAGRTTPRYAELRANPGLDRAQAVYGVETQYGGEQKADGKTWDVVSGHVQVNEAGLALAEAGVAAMQETWPELDWTPDAAPDVDLRPGSSRLVERIAGFFWKRKHRRF